MLDLSKFKILVVDDEPDSLKFISAVLEDNGANVFTAENGIDALKAAGIVMPDLITLDLEMPQMDGGQVFEKLRKNPELGIFQYSSFPGNLNSGGFCTKDL